MTARPASPVGPTHVVCLADDDATLARLAGVLVAALPDAVIATATAATAPALDAGSCLVLAATLGRPSDADEQRGDDAGDALGAARRRAERVVHAGETALDLRHALSNPLAALLAEAQMLEMQALPGEPGQTAQRMVALCRRMMALVRTLDG